MEIQDHLKNLDFKAKTVLTLKKFNCLNKFFLASTHQQLDTMAI